MAEDDLLTGLATAKLNRIPGLSSTHWMQPGQESVLDPWYRKFIRAMFPTQPDPSDAIGVMGLPQKGIKALTKGVSAMDGPAKAAADPAAELMRRILQRSSQQADPVTKAEAQAGLRALNSARRK